MLIDAEIEAFKQILDLSQLEVVSLEIKGARTILIYNTGKAEEEELSLLYDTEKQPPTNIEREWGLDEGLQLFLNREREL